MKSTSNRTRRTGKGIREIPTTYEVGRIDREKERSDNNGDE